MNLTNALDMVRTFHKHIGAPAADAPCLLACSPTNAKCLAVDLLKLSLVASQNGDQLSTRLAMALEELSEWLFAHAQGDLVAAADAWADRLYVLLGDAVAAGMPGEELLSEVHHSNMTKESKTDWPGKGVKGTAYQPPDIRRILKETT